MGYADLSGDEPLPSTVPDAPLETSRFGLSVGRISVPTGSPATAPDLVRLVRTSAHDVVIVRYPADRVAWAAAALATGRAVIHADTLLYWAFTIGEGRNGLGTGFVAEAYEPASPGGSSMLDDLVLDVFAGYGNHYRSNPLFDDDAALDGYREWATATATAVDGGALVLRQGGRPVGLATYEVTGSCCEILLAGVVSEQRGEGAYRHILAGVERVAATRGCAELVISTQAQNIAAQRAWAAYGFRPILALDTLHLVRPELL